MHRIGIIGLGSIGRRHVDCLNLLGDHQIGALRSKRGSLTESKESVQDFYSWEEFYDFDPDAVIIATPTSIHVDSFHKLEKLAVPCLVEKPMHSNADLQVSESFQSKILVAYCMRFHKLYQYLKDYIKNNKGQIRSLSFERGYFLPLWHQYADYRTEYAARKDLGGGVVRTLSHELDLVLNWFGSCELIKSKVEHRSDLEIDVEDFAEFELKSKDGVRAEFHLDFINQNYTNKGRIELENVLLSFDFNTGKLISEKSNETLLSFDANELDKMYIEQMKDFLQFIETGKSQNCSFDQAMNSLRLIDQIAPH